MSVSLRTNVAERRAQSEETTAAKRRAGCQRGRGGAALFSGRDRAGAREAALARPVARESLLTRRASERTPWPRPSFAQPTRRGRVPHSRSQRAVAVPLTRTAS